MSTTDNSQPETTSGYQQLAAGFSAVVDAVPADRWSADSPCDGWSAGDVVAHMIDTQRDFLTGHDIAIGERPSLDDPAAAWRTHQEAVTRELADPAVSGRRFDGHFGPTTVGETLLRFYGFDMLAHRWDVATATGQELRFTDDELGVLEAAADGFGPALYSEGVCTGPLKVSADADRQTRLLARLGRAG